jgi:chloramphenicol-sensitive protein RarD
MTERSPFGFLCTLASYVCWGMFPFYFHALQSVRADEIVAHRIVWSLALVTLLLLAAGRWRAVASALASPRMLAVFSCSAFLTCANWGIYVYAIVTGQTLEASLGYFINPLVSVAIGALVLRERLSAPKLAAVLIAFAGVAWITLRAGGVPWLGLGLAFSFAFYGLIRKIAPLGSLEGLAMETIVLTPPALVYLFWLHGEAGLSFLAGGWDARLLLMAAGPITTIPLLLFAAGVRRIRYSTVGIIQYVSPTIVFLIGLFSFGEPFDTDRFIGFCVIWCAVLIFVAASLAELARHRRGLS